MIYGHGRPERRRESEAEGGDVLMAPAPTGSTRNTRLYDRRAEEVTLGEVGAAIMSG